MRASLIIAAHNEGDALWHTVGSCVETAGGLDYEIVVVDDDSNDGSIEEMVRRFPRVRLIRHESRLSTVPFDAVNFGPGAFVSNRRGVSPTKDLGARQARGDVLVFLDGHCKPANDALVRLIEDVEHLSGAAVITPTVVPLNVPTWEHTASRGGHGYFVELAQFHCGWLPLSELRGVDHRGRRFYESPALIGCALAVDRRLYDRVQGFDPHMRTWGVEDLDFGLKCSLLGFPILHDPAATVGHRFRSEFDNYSVPFAHLIVNQLRMARKNFTDGTWSDWVERCRVRHGGKLLDHPEGLWAQVWHEFEADRASVESERAYLMAHRIRDEFWYADRFGLSWPRLHSAPYFPSSSAAAAREEDEPQPSSSPPPCPVTIAFESSPLRAGFTKPVASSTLTVSTYLRCDPPGEVSHVTLTLSGKSRVTIEINEVIPETGYLTFGVKGKSATPDDEEKGDTIIEARYKGRVCATVKTVVVVPKAIGAPHPQPSGSVTPFNLAANSTTSPAYILTLGPNEVVLVTCYAQWRSIPVIDQFRKPLTSPYEGIQVEEQFKGTWHHINQGMSAQTGTYLDPVFRFTPKNGTVQASIYDKNSLEAQSWPADDKKPITVGDDEQDIKVRVGGHVLNPSILNRRLITASPDVVTIQWP